MGLTQIEAWPHQVLERTGRELVLSCSDVVEKLMGLVRSKDLKTLRYTTGNTPAFYQKKKTPHNSCKTLIAALRRLGKVKTVVVALTLTRFAIVRSDTL